MSHGALLGIMVLALVVLLICTILAIAMLMSTRDTNFD
jgi:hypothetical protein